MKFSLGLAAVLITAGLYTGSARAEFHDGGVLVDLPTNIFPYYEFESDRGTLQRSGPDLDGAGKMSGTLSVRRIRVTPTPRLVTKPVLVDIKCTGGVPGNGKDGDWHGFFNVPKEEKAEALAASIKGIGVATAERIVRANKYFKSKPKSWGEFKAEIRRIGDELNVPVVENVLGNSANASANMANLDYRSKEGECREIWEDQTFITWEEVRSLDKSFSRNIEINVQGAPLLQGETEEFGARMSMGDDGELVVSVTPPDYYNGYTKTSKNEDLSTTSYRFQGTRHQVAPPSSLVQVAPQEKNGKLHFRVVNTNTVAGGTITVNLSSSEKKLFKSNTQKNSFTLEEGKTEGSFDTGRDSSGKKVVYNYNFQVTGSPYYSSSPSAGSSGSN
jgi:hypothetical protein